MLMRHPPVGTLGLTLALASLLACSSESADSPSEGSGASGGSAGSGTAGQGGNSAGSSSGGSVSSGGSTSSGGSGGSTSSGGSGGSTSSGGSVAGGSSGTGGTTSSGGSGGTPQGCDGKGIDTTSYSYELDIPPSQSPPGGMAVSDTPMFVSIGWDDNARSGEAGTPSEGNAMGWLTSYLASQDVTNTFLFASIAVGQWQSESPTYVKRSWNRAFTDGHEVGLHTHAHGHGAMFSVQQWSDEMDLNIDWLTKPYDPNEVTFEPDDALGPGFPRGELYGFRTPFLEYGDNLYQTLKARDVWYDCSIEEGWQGDQDGSDYFWPYTLDSGSPGHEYASQNGFPGKDFTLSSQPGLIEMPVYALIVPPDSEASSYGFPSGLRGRIKTEISWFDDVGGKITGFDFNLWAQAKVTKAEFLAILKYSLDLRLEGNRAPFMLGAHSDYYDPAWDTNAAQTTNRERQEAIEEFIEYALSKPEVRVVSMKEIVDWVRDPVPVSCL